MQKNARSGLDSYNTLYKAMGFERLGLFRLFAKMYHCWEVLYPGSSIHVTPSFVFPHVVYVDKSAQAKKFFSAHEEVRDFVTRNKEYKRKPFIQFLHQDYTEALPLQTESFDLLLSLFAGNITPVCTPYLRTGGLLLTNQRDRIEADFKLTAAIRFQAGKYQFTETGDIPPANPDRKYLRRSARGMEYVETETYFVFQKCRGKK